MSLVASSLVFCDRRNAEQMRRHDSIEEKRWAVRVARNAKERERLAPTTVTRIQVTRFDIPTFLRRQAG